MEQNRKDGTIPKTYFEKVITGLVLALVFGTFVVEVYVILPRMQGENYSRFNRLLHILTGCFILFNLCISIWKFMVVEIGVSTKRLSTNLMPGWRRCWTCRANFPPSSVVSIFVPLMSWFYDIEEEITILLSLFSAYCALCFFYVTVVFIIHLGNTLRGRTTVEIAKDFGFEYDVGLIENIEEAFGRNWMLGWISPLIKSPLPGNGFHFHRVKGFSSGNARKSE